MPNHYDDYLGQMADLDADQGRESGATEVIVKYNGDLREALSPLPVEVEELGAGYAILTLAPDLVSRLYDFKEIEYIELPKTLSLMLSESTRTACITPVQSGETYGLTGRGVLIGIIDSGIDYTHPDFLDQDGASRILRLWDQTAEGTPPAGFRAGAEYDKTQLDQALASPNPHDIVPSVDAVGHGTAVAGIAAGNGRAGGGREVGAAPEASLIVVKLGYRGRESFARTTEIMRAIKYVIDRAEDFGLPVAINISFGTNEGAHDGSSLFETYIDAMAQTWKTVIVVATGNEGAARHHFAMELEAGQTNVLGFVVGEQLDTLYFSLWKNFADDMALELLLPSGKSTGVLNPARRLTEMAIDGVDLQIYFGQPTHYNEDQEIYFHIRRRQQQVPQGLWRLRVIGEDIVDGRFDIWLPTLEEAGPGTTFTRPATDTTLTVPSTVPGVISVGGYNGAIQAAAQFSGRGYTRNNRYVKPDLVAPAVGIISARAGGGYDAFTGTSMAAPFVTGSAALMMQWGIIQGNDPFLYGQRIKAFLQKGAGRTAALTYPNPVWGYGTLCLRATMDYLEALL